MAEASEPSAAQLAAELAEAKRRIAVLEATTADRTLAHLTDTMLDGFSLLSADGVHLDVNPALCAMTGFSRDNLIGVGPPHPYWAPDEYPSIEAAFAKTLSGETETFPLTFVRKNGERFPVLVTPSLIRGKHGGVLAAYATVKDVSKLKRSEATLANSEELFRLTFDQAPIGAALVGLDFCFQRVNARFAQMTGYSTDELLQRGFPDITHPDDVAADVVQVKRLMSGEIDEYAREKRYVRKDGSISWGDVVVRPVIGGAQPLAFVAMVADLSERRLAELALRESEDKFKYVFDHSAVGKSLTLPTGQVNVNDAFGQMLGYTRDELADRSWQELTHPDDIAETDSQMDKLKTHAADSVRFLKRYLHKDGSVVWVDISSSLRRDGSGEPLYFMSTMLDVTERKRTERLLSVPSEILEMIAASTTVTETVEGIVAVLKRATGFDAVGLRLQEGEDYPFIGAQGYSNEFLEAENTLAMRDPDGGLCRDAGGAVSLECTCGLVITGRTDPADPLFTPGGSAWTNDSLPILDVPPEKDPRLHPRNRCIHVGFQSIALTPLRAGEEILGLLHLADRRTDRFTPESIAFFEGLGASIGVALLNKRAEAEIRRLNAELAERVVTRTAQRDAFDRELEAFAYSAAHDLRAPLRAIDGFSEILVEDAAERLTPEEMQHLERVRAAAQRMARMIDDLMGFSKATRRPLARRIVDVTAMAQEVAADLRAAEPERRVEVVVAPGMTAAADPTLLRLVLAQLLENAWKFTSKHDRARIEIGIADADGERAFFVRDDGAGFEMRYAEHLFGAFQRMHSADEFEGDGIGLATVRRLVARHGGRAWAEAEVDEGATIYFTLPSPAAAS